MLVVEDEAALATMLRYNLEKQGFRVEEAADGQEALTRIAEAQPDLVLLDWMLPVMSGIEVCRQIRRRADDARPAGDHGDGAHRGPGRGARPEHRRRRLHHQAVQHGGAAGAHARAAAPVQRGADEGAADASTTSTWTSPRIGCSRNGRPVHLGPTEFRLLEFFMQHPRRVFSREELLDAVWGPDIHVEPRTVDVHIRRLRKSINGAGELDVVRTVRAAGYALDTEPV